MLNQKKVNQNTVSALEHLTARIDGTERLFEAKLGAIERRIDAAQASAERALDQKQLAQDAYNKSHNDLARELQIQAQTFVSRGEHKREIAEVRERVVSIDLAQKELSGKLTNVLESLSGLRVAHDGLAQRVARMETSVTASGGVKEWMWKLGVLLSIALWLWSTVIK